MSSTRSTRSIVPPAGRLAGKSMHTASPCNGGPLGDENLRSCHVSLG